jgi:hypothetical protein
MACFQNPFATPRGATHAEALAAAQTAAAEQKGAIVSRASKLRLKRLGCFGLDQTRKTQSFGFVMIGWFRSNASREPEASEHYHDEDEDHHDRAERHTLPRA